MLNSIAVGPVPQVIGYSLQAAALPFPVFALSSFLNGIGVSILVCACSLIAKQLPQPGSRMRKRTDMSPRSSEILKPKWGMYRLPTVRRWNSRTGILADTQSIRGGCLCRSSCVHSICTIKPLVVPLSGFLGTYSLQHPYFVPCLPRENTGRCVGIPVQFV